VTTLNVNLDLQLENFSLDVREEVELTGITALFGPSGAGKTTLLRVIAGLETGAQGRISLGEEIWQDTGTGRFVPPHDRRVGYVFQDGRLFPHLSVEGNLLFAHKRARQREGDSSAIELASVTKALELEPLLQRNPAALSGGEQQRVAMGRVLLNGPQVILMDEPLSALDLHRKAEIIPYIERLSEEFSIPMLYVTHNVEEVTRLAFNMLLLTDGRVAARGDIAIVLERVDHWPLTGRLEGGVVVQAAVEANRNGMTALNVEGQSLRIPAIDVAPGTLVRLRIQARDVALATHRPENVSIRNILMARLLSIDLDETVFAELLLQIGDQHLRSRVTREAVEDLKLKEGQDVFALIKSVAFDGRSLN